MYCAHSFQSRTRSAVGLRSDALRTFAVRKRQVIKFLSPGVWIPSNHNLGFICTLSVEPLSSTCQEVIFFFFTKFHGQKVVIKALTCWSSAALCPTSFPLSVVPSSHARLSPEATCQLPIVKVLSRSFSSLYRSGESQCLSFIPRNFQLCACTPHLQEAALIKPDLQSISR